MLLYPLTVPLPDSVVVEHPVNIINNYSIYSPFNNSIELLNHWSSYFQFGHTAVSPTETYPFSVVMDRAEKLHLFWKYDETTITFEIHAQTLGYVGFGISPNGQMSGSDMVIGWVSSGNAYFHVSIWVSERVSYEMLFSYLSPSRPIGAIWNITRTFEAL